MNDKICGFYLDDQQKNIVLDDSDYLLVIAGAGSGKTLTILGKINYLIKYKNIKSDEILCISFTNASATSLKEKIKKEFNIDMPVYTFHKLSLSILKDKNYSIADDNILINLVTDFFDDIILSSINHMKLVLDYFNIKITNKNIKDKYMLFIKNNPNKIKEISKTIVTFIKLFKCNNYKLDEFIIFLRKIKITLNYKKYKTKKIFLILVLNIYLIYQNTLNENNEIDFDDMLIKATEYVKYNDIRFNYKYIIIDEYQDTSFIRFKIIHELIIKLNAKLMVVGDDFQSIYKFTGCDISLFLNFNKYFKNAKILKIENTYRNSQELISVAGNFVMKNKKQMKKNLKSNKHIKKPIKLIYYKNKKIAFEKAILYIYKKMKTTILVLGRNNYDINKYLNSNFILTEENKIVYLENNDINIYYLTTHKSKGLEEENVLIINLEDDLLGFPNKIIDDDMLNLVSISKERFKYAEERRLFYVALTRTKNNVFLLVNINKKSIFIKELEKKYFNYIEKIKT